MTRAEHMAWAKQRALEYVDRDDLSQAFASIASDLNKHPQTSGHAGVEMGSMLLKTGHLSTADEMRRFIDGFN